MANNMIWVAAATAVSVVGFGPTVLAQEVEPTDAVPARDLTLPEDDAWQDDWPFELVPIETDGLTSMQSWLPDELPFGQTTFKTGAVCRRMSGDWFGVAAVFTWDPTGTDPADYLYWFIVDGWESSGMFGKKVGSHVLLDVHPDIRNVHCTSNRATINYVAWDRANAGGVHFSTARMEAMNFLSYAWPTYAEIGTYLGSSYDVYAHRPRVAWQPGDIILVASNQMRFADPSIGGGSGMWFERYNAATGAYLGSSIYWDESCNVASWDVRWNGYDNFVVTMVFTNDPVPYYPWDYRSVLVTGQSHLIPCNSNGLTLVHNGPDNGKSSNSPCNAGTSDRNRREACSI